MTYEREHDEPHSRAYVMGQLARRRQEAVGGDVVNPFLKVENKEAFFAGFCDEHDMIAREKGAETDDDYRRRIVEIAIHRPLKPGERQEIEMAIGHALDAIGARLGVRRNER